MAELKAAPLFGSVRLQRLARGYTTTARTPVSPAASAVAPSPLPPPSPSPTSRSQSHQLSRRDSPHGARAASTRITRNGRLKDRWSMVRRSGDPRRIEEPSRSSKTGKGRRRPIPGTGAGGTGEGGEGARVTRGTHTVYKWVVTFE